MSEPIQKPGRSRQDYGTPPEFLAAVKAQFCIYAFAFDLAASAENAVAPKFFTAADDALTRDWPRLDGWCWLNPPFARIGPWVKKAVIEAERGTSTILLVPAAVGSNWWRDYVHQRADVTFINGRITFVGCTDPFPKDCALLRYSWEFVKNRTAHDYEVWDWRKELTRKVA